MPAEEIDYRETETSDGFRLFSAYSGAPCVSGNREFSYIWLSRNMCGFSFFSDSRISFASGKNAVMKILIVEDEPSLREIMVQTLRREQYVVEQAADYASALDKIAGYDQSF